MRALQLQPATHEDHQEAETHGLLLTDPADAIEFDRLVHVASNIRRPEAWYADNSSADLPPIRAERIPGRFVSFSPKQRKTSSMEPAARDAGVFQEAVYCRVTGEDQASGWLYRTPYSSVDSIGRSLIPRNSMAPP